MRRVVERLNIAVHGDRLHKARTVEIVYRERMEREIGFQTVDIPEPKQSRTGKYRASQNTVDPSPNAPLLKRVVQHPYALEKGYFKRANLPRVKIQPREKIVFPQSEKLQKPRFVQYVLWKCIFVRSPAYQQ